MNQIKIIGFTGSLRQNSYNKAALFAAKELLPNEVTLDVIDLSLIPFFNEDDEVLGISNAVSDFREKLQKADAFLISTPEYNFSIPPVLKNALDWASRGPDYPLNHKPIAIMSASPSVLGGARVQYHLRQVCGALNMIAINQPEVFIMESHKKFDQDGKLIDEYTKNAIKKLLDSLITEIIKNNV